MLPPERHQCLRCGSPDAEWVIDDELGRVLVCLRCEAVMPALDVQRALESGDDDG
jgi:uncharacterized OB-fold protein